MTECSEAKADCFPKISGQCLPCHNDLTILSLRGGVYDPLPLDMGGIVSQLHLFSSHPANLL